MGRQFKETEQRSELLGNCHPSNKHSRTANQSVDEAGSKSPGGGAGVSAAQIKKARTNTGKNRSKMDGPCRPSGPNQYRLQIDIFPSLTFTPQTGLASEGEREGMKAGKGEMNGASHAVSSLCARAQG